VEQQGGNDLKVRRSTIEQMLLDGIKDSLLSDDAYRAFEIEARALLKASKPDASVAKRRILDAQKELDNLMAAIRAGIVTPTTKAALLEAEQQIADAKDELQAIEQFEPTQVLPRAREVYRDLVGRLEAIEDVTVAREALRDLIGEVRLVPENATLTAEIQSAGLAGALRITVVAGATSGYETVH
jgi:hypothetical protein